MPYGRRGIPLCGLCGKCPGDGTAGTVAWVRDPGPAVAAERDGDEGGALAGALGDAHRAEAEGLRSIRREVQVVAVFVRRGAVALVVSRPVNLNGHAVPGVPVVLV